MSEVRKNTQVSLVQDRHIANYAELFLNSSLEFRIHALEIIFYSKEHMIPPFQNLYVKNPNC